MDYIQLFILSPYLSLPLSPSVSLSHSFFVSLISLYQRPWYWSNSSGMNFAPKRYSLWSCTWCGLLSFCYVSFRLLGTTMVTELLAQIIVKFKTNWDKQTWIEFIIYHIAKFLPSILSIFQCHWMFTILQWIHNGPYDVSNHQYLDSLLSTHCSGAHQSKHQSHECRGHCERNPLVTSGFPSQRVSNAKNASIRWPHHDICNISFICEHNAIIQFACSALRQNGFNKQLLH